MTDRAEAAISKSNAPDPLIGRVINERFKIVSLIARGGMGKVYRAEQAPLGRACALKVLNPNYSGEHDPEFHKRFFLEASMTSKLTHPNTVTIFDYGRADDDIYYMAMEYLEGHTLHRAIRTAGHFPEERTAHVARQVCRALREAHALGIVHRDLKPANVYLIEHADEPDFVKVLDFGLVKNVADVTGEELTQAGLFMGSPKYMAPEQVNGEKVDARTDIYALGILMYEMMTGKVPFDSATSVSILMAQVKEKAPPMREANPDAQVSDAMEETVARCMAKAPDDRFRSMDEVLAALKRVTASATLGSFGGGPRSNGAATGDSHAFSSTSTTGSGPRVGHASSATPASGFGVAATPGLGGTSAGSTSEVGSFPSPLSMPSDGPGSNAPLLSAPPPGRGGSKGMLLAAVAGALAIAGTIAFVALRPAPAGGASGASQPAAAPQASAPAGVATATGATGAPSAAPALAKVRINTDPDGASVKEDGVELCSSTPCDILYKGPDADPAREHKLTVARQGYKSETRSIHAADGPVAVKLSKADLPRIVPQPQKVETPAAVPTGYKTDVPY
jgi:serine/threonine-protein kinase